VHNRAISVDIANRPEAPKYPPLLSIFQSPMFDSPDVLSPIEEVSVLAGQST